MAVRLDENDIGVTVLLEGGDEDRITGFDGDEAFSATRRWRADGTPVDGQGASRIIARKTVLCWELALGAYSVMSGARRSRSFLVRDQGLAQRVIDAHALVPAGPRSLLMVPTRSLTPVAQVEREGMFEDEGVTEVLNGLLREAAEQERLSAASRILRAG